MPLTANQATAIHQAIDAFIEKHKGATPEKVFVHIRNMCTGVTLMDVKTYLDSIGHVSGPEEPGGNWAVVVD